jgi:hypothetical protein
MARMRRTASPVLLVPAAVVLVLNWSTVAAAHHKADHAGGPPAAGATSAVVTEDDDPDGVPNTPDPLGDTDNRHPSGNDKHAEAGASGNQGKAASEPDANGHGPERDAAGLDQPAGPGGLDVLDQDGNNGCGNDDDFEDDNEGLCQGREQPPGQQVQDEQEVVAPSAGTVAPVTTEVAGEVVTAGGKVQAEVLGENLAGESKGVEVGPLAFTGTNALALLAVSAGLALVGVSLLRLGRLRT